MFFGLRYLLKQLHQNVTTSWAIDRAEEFYAKHGVPFNADGWREMISAYPLVYPIRVRAVPEGTLVPAHRSGDPSEVGAVIASLVTPGAGYLTGQVIVVDGGNSIAEERRFARGDG